MKEKRFQARQGDVFFESVDEIPSVAVPVERDAAGRIVLAEGEVTGHAHVVLEPDAEFLAVADQVDRWLRAGGQGATVVHEEHGAIALPAGGYRIRRQREYAPEAIRRVTD